MSRTEACHAFLQENLALEPHYEAVPMPDGSGIAFEIDRRRGLLRIVRRRVAHYFDLTQLLVLDSVRQICYDEAQRQVLR